MTESEVIKELQCNIDLPFGVTVSNHASRMAINALEKQEKIKEAVANANKWSNILVKAQAFCEIEKILRSDEK